MLRAVGDPQAAVAVAVQRNAAAEVCHLFAMDVILGIRSDMKARHARIVAASANDLTVRFGESELAFPSRREWQDLTAWIGQL